MRERGRGERREGEEREREREREEGERGRRERGGGRARKGGTRPYYLSQQTGSERRGAGHTGERERERERERVREHLSFKNRDDPFVSVESFSHF
jgi:hypothetical protein